MTIAHKLYCVKCKKKRACDNVKQERDVRGKPRLHGICKHCECNCFQYIKVAKSKSKGKKSR